MAFQPVGAGGSIAIAANGTTVTTSSFIQHRSNTLRLSADSASCHVAVGVGSTPTAAATDAVILKNSTATINIGRPSAQRVVGMTTSGATTVITFPEGTGCPFAVDQLVSVTTTNSVNKHWEFSNKLITSINSNYPTNNTQMTVANDYTDFVGTAFTAFVDSQSHHAEARDVVKVSNKGVSVQPYGALWYQQVQISGDA
tara:strand:+ start:446 stop:1042 length:597 start_codon:yes stop_codon:yes gene_type:complete